MPNAIVIAQSIVKVLAPTCFENEGPVFEHVFECVWTNVFSKHTGTQKCIPKDVQKRGPHFQSMLWGLTHSYSNRVFPGMINILPGPN